MSGFFRCEASIFIEVFFGNNSSLQQAFLRFLATRKFSGKHEKHTDWSSNGFYSRDAADAICAWLARNQLKEH